MVANMPSTVAAPSAKVSSRGPSPAKPKRAPLLPSDADNNRPPLPFQLKCRDVSSRYLSSTASSDSSSTASSDSITSTMTSSSSSNSVCTPVTKRALSTERRRPGTPRIGAMSATEKMLTRMPARSLSASFQGQSFAVPVSKALDAFNSGSRRSSPEKRALTPVRKLGIPKPVDQRRWPGREESFMTKSLDFTNENMKLSGSGTESAVRALQKSIIRETKLKPNKPEINRNADKVHSDSDNSDLAVSDVESISSGSIQGVKPGALMVPARFRQETVNCLRRVQSEPVSSPLYRNIKLMQVDRRIKDGPALSPQGLSPSPVRRAVRPDSPSKSVLLPLASSPLRGKPVPARVWSGIWSIGNEGNAPSILSLAAESRRRKVGDTAIVDAHELRLLHNRYLQWRFANARADAAMLVQRETAQKSLYNTWVTTLKIRQSVISKQIEIQQLSQNLKLYAVLKNQIPYLKMWDQVEKDHIVSLSETIASLEYSILRLPLVDGAKENVQSLKDAISSAADVMHAMTSLIRSLVTKVEHVNILASKLANTTRNECSMIVWCKELLSILTHIEMQDCSLRTHMLQLERLLSTTITEL